MSNALLRVVGIHDSHGEHNTDVLELKGIIAAAASSGNITSKQRILAENILNLVHLEVRHVMTPRTEIDYLDVADDVTENLARIGKRGHSRWPLCDGDLDHVLGMVRVKDLLAELLEGKALDLTAAMRKPLFVPESLRALRLLELFRESGVHLAVVIDEYGGVDGLLTLQDVLEELTGSLTSHADPRVVQREDGSWLVDASLTMDEFWEWIGLEERRGEERRDYHTVAGLTVTTLGRIPQTGDAFEVLGLRFEVVDMDGHRVDKVLVGARGGTTPDAAEPEADRGGSPG